MKCILVIPLMAILLTGCARVHPPGGKAGSGIVLVRPESVTPMQELALGELQRYLYLRTRAVPAIADQAPEAGDAILLAVTPDDLDEQEYRLSTQPAGACRHVTIAGGDDRGVLYGAYHLIETLGVRFELHGDVIPDEELPEDWRLPDVNEDGSPLFALRGLLPFHDFPEGPDWWSRDDWKAFIAQAAKMRMNFVGLHTYPFKNKDLGPEPTVWVGLPEDVNPDGTVKASDHASWYTTSKLMPYGCYAPATTGSYSFGGSLVFPADDHGPEVNGPDDYPMPRTPEACTGLINRTGVMLNDVFTLAHDLGMTTCVGTESPLDIPDTVQAQLKDRGMDPADEATLTEVYKGMFLRIQRAFPVDYYWIWGHEGEIDQERFVSNMKCADAALAQLGDPFGLGICGWGWITGNFPPLDQALPRDVVFSAISMSLGKAPVSPNFGALGDRPKWAIPWFEDDGGLSSPQLWVGRMRKDAVDARQYGCDGLMGLHWRTRILGPNISALARAGWDQDGWPQAARTDDGESGPVVVLGGRTASFLNNVVAGADSPILYQTVRFDLEGYRFVLPNGTYRVTLRFCEPAYQAAGKRVFGVKLQGVQAIQGLDVFAEVGQNTAMKRSFDRIVVTDGQLRIDFVPEVEYPCVAAIEVVGVDAAVRVNCGGGACEDFVADPQPVAEPRELPSADFYADWALAQFGPDVAEEAASLFTQLDGRNPKASSWIRGPGAILVTRQPRSKEAEQFAFVESFAALRERVRGEAQLERFDWWLNTFRKERSQAMLGAVRGELDSVMEKIAQESDPQARRRLVEERALPLRRELVDHLGDLYRHLLATVNNSSELGAIVNLEQQSLLRLKLLTAHDDALEDLLGKPLPADCTPPREFQGEPRLVVVTARGLARCGEGLGIPVIFLDAKSPKSVALHWRPMGRGAWKTVPLRHIARAVYGATLPPIRETIEYYVEGETAEGEILRWPAAAPRMNQTVVVASFAQPGNRIP